MTEWERKTREAASDEDRRKAREAAWLLRSSLKDLERDLHEGSDEIIVIQWEQVQADFTALKGRILG
jgi:hypothetical protein